LSKIEGFGLEIIFLSKIEGFAQEIIFLSKIKLVVQTNFWNLQFQKH